MIYTLIYEEFCESVQRFHVFRIHNMRNVYVCMSGMYVGYMKNMKSLNTFTKLDINQRIYHLRASRRGDSY